MNKLLSKARINKDKNFDGKFFFAVKTTGIFCRPSCPSPIAKEENVCYFNTLFAALEQGFRPCLRCRPDITTEYYNSNPSGSNLVQSALHLMYEGYLNHHSIAELALFLSISERHLRKLFVDNLGSTPTKIARYNKALFAKKLLLYSNHPITDVAFASGFSSVRQFNEVFRKTFGTTPTAIRRDTPTEKQDHGTTLLHLNYQKPFDFHRLLTFLGPRSIRGVEVITEESYKRTFRTEHAEGFFTVTDNPKKSYLELSIDCNDPRCYMAIYNRVRRMFDLDTDFSAINTLFGSDQLLCRGMVKGHVPRLPLAFDPFEFVIRAILGQQISVKAATTLAGRIAQNAKKETPAEFPEGLDYFFPNPEELLAIDLGSIGVTQTRQETLKIVTQAILDGSVRLTKNQSPEDFHHDFSALKGIGDWTVSYVAMRGLGMIDSFPYSDLGVIKALTNSDKAPTKKEILSIAEQWRPYRTYATLCLWQPGAGEIKR